MERGYTFVMVDLRGFGGSTGCLDWGGPGEQSDVVNAVQWAADAAVVDRQGRHVRQVLRRRHRPDRRRQAAGRARRRSSRRSRSTTSTATSTATGSGARTRSLTPALYDLIDATPGPIADDPNYNVGGADDTQRPGCLAANYADQAANDDHDSAYWKARNLIPGATGSDVPLFLTQGLTENNTVADGTAQYLQNHTGYERAWLGPWEHVRGNETDESGRLKMGRAGWFDEVMRFYDRFLKGADAGGRTTRRSRSRPTTASGAPSRAGRRPTRAATRRRCARARYTDDGTANATGDGAETGVWTISPPLPHDVHLSGSGSATVDVTTTLPERQPRARRLRPRRERHRAADHAPGPPDPLERARSRSTSGRRTGSSRPATASASRVADANADWWVHVPTKQTRHRRAAARSRCRSCRPRATPARSRATRARSSPATCRRP